MPTFLQGHRESVAFPGQGSTGQPRTGPRDSGGRGRGCWGLCALTLKLSVLRRLSPPPPRVWLCLMVHTQAGGGGQFQLFWPMATRFFFFFRRLVPKDVPPRSTRSLAFSLLPPPLKTPFSPSSSPPLAQQRLHLSVLVVYLFPMVQGEVFSICQS